jgi:hypothetical protein
MLAAIAEKIADKGMSIENVETQLRMHGGHREFVVDVFVSSTKHSDGDNLKELVNDISQIKEDLNLDTLNIRVHSGNV